MMKAIELEVIDVRLSRLEKRGTREDDEDFYSVLNRTRSVRRAPGTIASAFITHRVAGELVAQRLVAAHCVDRRLHAGRNATEWREYKSARVESQKAEYRDLPSYSASALRPGVKQLEILSDFAGLDDTPDQN